jgi:SAM-dependent methyltransferase
MAVVGRIMLEQEIKQQVQDFYNQVGWQEVSEGVYQNARYEDLRPVSQEYIHRCHMRVLRHLKTKGRLLLDAGSGPIQYPVYLKYSQGYKHRVCADISIVALQEARKRIGKHGLFVVCDIAQLPFRPDVFEGAVSLHTVHHLPLAEQVKAYKEIHRVICPDSAAVIVNGWPASKMMDRWGWLVQFMERLIGWATLIRKGNPNRTWTVNGSQPRSKELPKSTFTERIDAESVRRTLKGLNFEIYVWRSVSVSFLRALIHPFLGGKLWLRLLFWLEEGNPQYYGMVGQYPMIVLQKKNSSFLSKGNI